MYVSIHEKKCINTRTITHDRKQSQTVEHEVPRTYVPKTFCPTSDRATADGLASGKRDDDKCSKNEEEMLVAPIECKRKSGVWIRLQSMLDSHGIMHPDRLRLDIRTAETIGVWQLGSTFDKRSMNLHFS